MKAETPRLNGSHCPIGVEASAQAAGTGALREVMAASTLFGGMSGAQGFGAALMSWFQFFPGLLALVRGWIGAAGI